MTRLNIRDALSRIPLRPATWTVVYALLASFWYGVYVYLCS